MVRAPAFKWGVKGRSGVGSVAIIAALLLAGAFPYLGDAVEFISYTLAGDHLSVGWTESYNGVVIEQKDFHGNISAIFNLTDIKPGDYGAATIRLRDYASPSANVTMVWIPKSNDDLSTTEPELAAGDLPEDPGDLWDGELAESMDFEIWRDTNQNGVHDSYEQLFYSGTAPLSQREFYLGVFPTYGMQYVGVSWSLGSGVGNRVQSDSYVADVRFEVMTYAGY